MAHISDGYIQYPHPYLSMLFAKEKVICFAEVEPQATVISKYLTLADVNICSVYIMV